MRCRPTVGVVVRAVEVEFRSLALRVRPQAGFHVVIEPIHSRGIAEPSKWRELQEPAHPRNKILWLETVVLVREWGQECELAAVL